MSVPSYIYLAWKQMADEMGIYFDEKKLELATYKNNLYREYLSTMTPADVTDDVRSTLAAHRDFGDLLTI